MDENWKYMNRGVSSTPNEKEIKIENESESERTSQVRNMTNGKINK